MIIWKLNRNTKYFSTLLGIYKYIKPTVRYIEDILKRDVSFILKFRDKNLSFDASLDLNKVIGQESDIIQALI